VGWINARRRRPVAGYAALLLGLVFIGLLYGALTRTGGGAQTVSGTVDTRAAVLEAMGSDERSAT